MPSPMFITWKDVVTEASPILRGCIGTFQPQPLYEGLRRYTIKSALEDDRFSPIKAKELENLSCSVSLLTDFAVVKDWNGWEIGTHGITIEFSKNGQSYKATFLPEVASEQGSHFQNEKKSK